MPSLALRRVIKLPELPVNVNVPSIVCVLVASNWSGLLAVAQVKLLNVVSP